MYLFTYNNHRVAYSFLNTFYSLILCETKDIFFVYINVYFLAQNLQKCKYIGFDDDI